MLTFNDDSVSASTQIYNMTGIETYFKKLTNSSVTFKLESNLVKYFKRKKCDDINLDLNGSFDSFFRNSNYRKSNEICPVTINANINLCRWPPIILESMCKSSFHEFHQFKAKCFQMKKPVIVRQSYNMAGQLTLPILAIHQQSCGCFFSEITKTV